MAHWQYPTNIEVNSTEGMSNILVYLNEVSFGWFANMFLIAVWMIFFAGFYYARRDAGGGMAVAGFVTFVMGLLLWIMDALSTITFAIVIAVAIIGFAGMWATRE